MHADPLTEELSALEAGQLDLAGFPHCEHVRLGFEMLGRYEFGEAVSRFSRGLKQLAQKSGKPGAYHETITIGFLALIAERRARDEQPAWPRFCAANSDLLDKQCLRRWYAREQLQSQLARTAFCLPAPLQWTGRIARVYAAVLAGYILWSSVLTASSAAGHNRGVFALAAAEIGGALGFVFDRTRTAALVVLLIVFAIAGTAEFHFGSSFARFFFYAASALFAWRMTRQPAYRL